MSIPYTQGGRVRQKQRTSDALVQAARAILRRGDTPSVEEAAEAAGISRATAYRYFPNQQALLVVAHPEVETPSLLGEDPPADPAERLDRVVTSLVDLFLDAEESYRAMLRLSLESDGATRELALRKGRRYLWIEEALDPLRKELGADRHMRLVHAVAAATGIEALVSLIDLGGLDRDRAREVIRWSTGALLHAARAEAEGRRH